MKTVPGSTLISAAPPLDVSVAFLASRLNTTRSLLVQRIVETGMHRVNLAVERALP
jgi:hypothetical protein